MRDGKVICVPWETHLQLGSFRVFDTATWSAERSQLTYRYRYVLLCPRFKIFRQTAVTCMFNDDVGFEGCVWMHPPFYFTCRVHRHFPGTEQEAARCRYKNQIRAVTLQYEVLKTEKLRRTGLTNQCLWVRRFLRKMQSGLWHIFDPRSVPSGCWVCPTPSCWSLTPSCPWLSQIKIPHCQPSALTEPQGLWQRWAATLCQGFQKPFDVYWQATWSTGTPRGGCEMLHAMSCWLPKKIHRLNSREKWWNMDQWKTRNKKHAYDTPWWFAVLLQNCHCEGWPWCAISGLLWVASSRWPESKSFWHDCSCGCESRVPLEQSHGVCVCVSQV